MTQKGFLLRVTLCCVGVVIALEWKMPDRRSEEEEESRAADGELLEQCWLSERRRCWTFGGVLSSLAGNHTGGTSYAH